MNAIDTAAVKILEAVGNRLWSLKPNLMREIVHQHGGGRSLKWFATHMPHYEKILKAIGPIRTHLLATEISVLNGCAYCTYGHAYALQLHYFQQNRALLQLDEQDFVTMAALPLEDKTGRLRRLLDNPELAQGKNDFETMLSQFNGESAVHGEHSSDIAHLLGMFKFLNFCGIEGCTSPDGAHDPINKNLPLKAEYSTARAVE